MGCLASSTAIAQKESYIWHFGDRAGIDFNTTPPRQIIGPYNSVIEGSATICDPYTGQLLISTDGTTVWNRDLQPMPNGNGLIGGSGTSTQGAIIVPFPSNEDLYYIFTCDQSGYAGANQGVKYSIVDMSLDGGKGDVTTKNVDVFAPEMTEKLTAIPHANGCDFWVIAHKQNPDFMAIQVGDSIIGTPVVSRVGHFVSNHSTESIGYLVSDQAGTMLVYVAESGSVWILDFDKATGIVSSHRMIYSTGDHLYGASFSPDGTKLYVGSYSLGELMQFDVALPTPDEISASRTVLYSNSTGSGIGGIRPGPDGKIYVGMFNTSPISYVGVIEQPNAAGTACDFNPQAIPLVSGTQVWLGLPNVLDAFVGRNMRPCLTGPPPKPVSIETEFGTICAGGCIEFAEVGADGRKIEWHISDGRKIEGLATPSICFDSAGEYTVELLAIGSRGDTSRSTLVPVTIKPALSFELQSYAVVTDTIGAVVQVPIVLNSALTSTFTASFSFDPELLEYAGAFDENGIPIDSGSHPENGELIVSKELVNGNIIGYLYFNMWWEDNNRCRSVQLTGSSLSNTSPQCLSNDVSYEMCLDEACGTSLISQFVRTSRIEVSIAPNPTATRLELAVDHDMEDATITMIDERGVEVMNRSVTLFKGRKESIDVRSLPVGVYFLALRSATGVARETVVIQR